MVIVPLSAEGRSGIPVLTFLVCLACVGVFLYTKSAATLLSLAYYPHSFDVLRMFTSSVAHNGLLHIVGNLFFFWCFASTIECEIKPLAYVVAFVIFVFVTSLVYDVYATSDIPTVGLSGVVWGYMGLFLLRFPTARITSFVWFLWIFRRIEVPAALFVLGFLALDISAAQAGGDDSTNYVAHFSGFAAGAMMRLALWNVMTRDDDSERKPVRRGVTSAKRAPPPVAVRDRERRR